LNLIRIHGEVGGGRWEVGGGRWEVGGGRWRGGRWEGRWEEERWGDFEHFILRAAKCSIAEVYAMDESGPLVNPEGFQKDGRRCVARVGLSSHNAEVKWHAIFTPNHGWQLSIICKGIG